MRWCLPLSQDDFAGIDALRGPPWREASPGWDGGNRASADGDSDVTVRALDCIIVA